MQTETATQKLARIERYIAEDTAAAASATEAGDHAAAAVFHAAIGNLLVAKRRWKALL